MGKIESRCHCFNPDTKVCKLPEEFRAFLEDPETAALLSPRELQIMKHFSTNPTSNSNRVVRGNCFKHICTKKGNYRKEDTSDCKRLVELAQNIEASLKQHKLETLPTPELDIYPDLQIISRAVTDEITTEMTTKTKEPTIPRTKTNKYAAFSRI